ELRAALLHGKAASSIAEKRIVRKDGSVIWVRRTASVVRDTGGLPLYLVRIVEDVTAHKEAEERYRATFDNAPVGILHSDIDNDRILRVNRKLCEILGYSESELLAMETADLLHTPDRHTDRPNYYSRMLAGDLASYSSERPFVRKDGTLVWTNRTVSLVRDASAKPLYFIRIIEDISTRKRIEQELRTNVERFEVVARATNDAVWDWDLKSGKLWWNDGYRALFGYSPDGTADTVASWSTYLHADDRERVVTGMHAVIERGGIYWTDEYRFRRADGADAHIYDRGYVIRDESGRALRMVGAMMDISERKRTEHAVQRTSQLNALLQALATSANEAVTPEQAFLACLARLSAFSGWVLGRVVMFGTTEVDYDEQFSIWHGADDERWAPFREACEPLLPVRKQGLVSRVFETGQALWVEKLPTESAAFRRAAAARACGLCSALAFPVIAAGRNYALIEFYADRPLPPDAALLEAIPYISGQLARVAERRFSENALLESERFARATMDALSQHICVVDEAGAIIAVNKSWRTFAELNGYSARTAWVGENFFQVSDKATGMSNAEVAYVASGIRDVLSGAQDEFTTEYSCRADAEQRWLSVKATRFPGAGPKRAVISYENVTDRALSHRRRAMEHAVTSVLAESASLSEAMPKLIRTMCEAMDWAYGALWSWGGDEDKVLRRTEHWSEMPLDPDTEDRRYWEELESGSAGGLLRRGLHRREATWIVDVQSDPTFKRRPTAQKLGLVSAYAFPIFAANNVIGMMEFFGRDVRQPDEMLLLITRSVGSQIGQYIQRKEAEQALRVSEERFRITISQAAVGITVTGLDLRYLMVNGKYAEIMGYTQEELLGLSVKDVVRPCDYDETLSFRQRMLQGETGTFDREKQLVRKDGSPVWVMLSTSLVRGEKGEAKHYISVIQDISDRKRAELALRESEEKFIQLSSNIPQVFWISDATLKETIYVSSACESMLGIPMEALKRRP
ncbi:MAG TPA: PAS domain S-box protein, partial [Burkholderiales bacterium]